MFALSSLLRCLLLLGLHLLLLLPALASAGGFPLFNSTPLTSTYPANPVAPSYPQTVSGSCASPTTAG